MTAIESATGWRSWMRPSRPCRIGPAVFLLWPREGAPYLSKTDSAAAAPVAAAEGAREAFAAAQSARNRAAHRVSIYRLGFRIGGAALRTGAPPFSRTYLDAHQAAHAALREDRARERVSAQPDHHPPHARRALFRAVPFARFGRAVRIAVPRSVPDAAVPGGSGAIARASGLHLRRDGDVPASVPASGWSGGVCATR